MRYLCKNKQTNRIIRNIDYHYGRDNHSLHVLLSLTFDTNTRIYYDIVIIVKKRISKEDVLTTCFISNHFTIVDIAVGHCNI